MSIVTMILGDSGTGKSHSLMNLVPEETLLIRSIKKPLPFKSKEWKKLVKGNPSGSIFDTDNPLLITGMLSRLPENKKVVVIDDFQYIMANEFMRRSKERGFDKFTEIGKNAWDIIETATRIDSDVRVYILSHTSVDDSGTSRIKTIGKLLDDKITLEGMVTIVLRTNVTDGKYSFGTQNNNDTSKSPHGMFESMYIPNDLKEVDNAICDYYGIEDNLTNTTEEV